MNSPQTLQSEALFDMMIYYGAKRCGIIIADTSYGMAQLCVMHLSQCPFPFAKDRSQNLGDSAHRLEDKNGKIQWLVLYESC